MEDCTKKRGGRRSQNKKQNVDDEGGDAEDAANGTGSANNRNGVGRPTGRKASNRPKVLTQLPFNLATMIVETDVNLFTGAKYPATTVERVVGLL